MSDAKHMSASEFRAQVQASGELPAGYLTDRQKQTRKLGVLFAMLYFVQGTGEPSQGLVAQPVNSMLREWNLSAGDMAMFTFWLGLPWSIKPLFGLLTDFVPIAGTRRKSYLILTSMIMFVGLYMAAFYPLEAGDTWTLTLLLLLPTVGIAFGDVVTDGLMVEKGQPLGITSRLQSIQWTAITVAGLLCGYTGGLLAEYKMQRLGFAICGTLALVTFVLAIVLVDEPRTSKLDGDSLKNALKAIWQTARSPVVVAVGVFLFLLNFNPFSGTVIYLYETEQLGFSEQFVGTLSSLSSATGIVAAVLYGVYAPRLKLKWLIHGSIVTAILMNLTFLVYTGEYTAYLVYALYGFVVMLTTLAQLDLAAKFVPVASAGTAFALLMSLSNFSVSLSTVVGSNFYDKMLAATDREGAAMFSEAGAFRMLVLIGSAFTAACFFLTVLLPKEDAQAEAAEEAEIEELSRVSGLSTIEEFSGLSSTDDVASRMEPIVPDPMDEIGDSEETPPADEPPEKE